MVCCLPCFEHIDDITDLPEPRVTPGLVVSVWQLRADLSFHTVFGVPSSISAAPHESQCGTKRTWQSRSAMSSSGYELVTPECPLMTQSGHGLCCPFVRRGRFQRSESRIPGR